MSTLVSIPLIVLSLILATSFMWVIWDYRKWRALGPGGLPPNLVGWLKTSAMRLQKSDPISTECYRAQIGKPGDASFLREIPDRAGERPAIAVHPVPHRQLTQLADGAMRQKINDLFDALVANNPALLEFKQSYLEKRHPAVFLCDAENAHAHSANSHGEVAHIHPIDRSMHMILSPSDATTVIAARWGERHPLAGRALRGTGLVLPDTYLLIYPPRNDSELGVTRQILEAAVNHMLGSKRAGERLSPTAVASENAQKL